MKCVAWFASMAGTFDFEDVLEAQRNQLQRGRRRFVMDRLGPRSTQRSKQRR